MCCLKLTDEEIKRGNLIMAQLEREMNTPVSLHDLEALPNIIWTIAKDDWKNYSLIDKTVLMVIIAPLLHTICAGLSIIFC